MNFIFVMISPDAEPNVAAWGNSEYTVNGLYRNDGSTEPLWTVDWFALGVVVASDGSHLIRLGPWASGYFPSAFTDAGLPSIGGWYDQEAFTFFSDGIEIRSYRIDELVRDPESLPAIVPYFFSILAGSQLDDGSGTWSIVTLRGEYYKFDVSTGEILSSFLLRLWILGVGAPLILVPLIVVLRRRSFARHVIAMSVASCLWTLLVMYSFSGYLSLGSPSGSDMVISILLSLTLIGVAGIALLPAGVFWLLKRKYMPGTLWLMWAVWCLAALTSTALLLTPPLVQIVRPL